MDAALWAAKIAEFQVQVEFYALKVRMEQMMGYRKLQYGGRSRPTRTAPAKCPCCGSREYRQHNSVRICAYCRSGE